MATKKITLAQLFCHIPKGEIELVSADFGITGASGLVIVEANILDGDGETLSVIHVPVSMKSYAELCSEMAGTSAPAKGGPTRNLRKLKAK